MQWSTRPQVSESGMTQGIAASRASNWSSSATKGAQKKSAFATQMGRKDGGNPRMDWEFS